VAQESEVLWLGQSWVRTNALRGCSALEDLASSASMRSLASVSRRSRWNAQPKELRDAKPLHIYLAMKFQRIEFSWRAAYIGLYLTPERDKLWVTIVPFFPLYFKKV
jgi:hypothetical protein